MVKLIVKRRGELPLATAISENCKITIGAHVYVCMYEHARGRNVRIEV